jgi:formylglycine-generating enzyme required for sulfatase activity
VLRGGSWYNGGVSVRSADRAANDPVNGYFNIGFRCALAQ